MATTVKRPDERGGKRETSRRISTFVRSHTRLVVVAGLVIAVLGISGFLWFRPDKLFVDTTVDEALPTASVPAAGGGATTGAPAASNVVLSTGRFRNLEHTTTGVAKIVRLVDGSRIVRLEDFKTSSGPDVVVMLSSTPATEDAWGAYDDGAFVNLGELRGNVGSQNYGIPADVDISTYRSVVIWCRRFTVGFGAAPITPTT